MNNQEAYPKQNPPLPTYVNGAYNTVRDNTTSPPPENFDPNETYSWTPIAGGKGWGNPSGTASGASSASGTQGSGRGSGVTLVHPNSAANPGQSGANSQGGGQGSGVTLVHPNSAAVKEKSGAKVESEDDCEDDSHDEM